MVKRHRGRLLALSSHWCYVDGRKMYFRASPPAEGQRLPVVLVHGLGMSGRYLLPTAAALAADFPVYVPDLPGFGQSEEPPQVLDVPELAEALRAWMEVMGLERAYLLGNSLGCQTIAALAAGCPERVERAVFVSPPLSQSNPLGLIGRALLDVAGEPWSLLPILARDFWHAGPWRALQTFRAMLESGFEAWLPQIETPILVVGGTQDKIVPVAWVQQVAGMLPRGRATLLQGAGHASNFSHPAELAALARSFFESPEGPLTPQK